MQRRRLLLLHGRLWQGRKQSWDWNLDGGSVPCEPLAVDRRAVVPEERRRASDQQWRNIKNTGMEKTIRCDAFLAAQLYEYTTGSRPGPGSGRAMVLFINRGRRGLLGCWWRSEWRRQGEVGRTRPEEWAIQQSNQTKTKPAAAAPVSFIFTKGPDAVMQSCSWVIPTQHSL